MKYLKISLRIFFAGAMSFVALSPAWAGTPRHVVVELLQKRLSSYEAFYAEQLRFLTYELGPAMAGLSSIETELKELDQKINPNLLNDPIGPELASERIVFLQLRLQALSAQVTRLNNMQSGEAATLVERIEHDAGKWLELWGRLNLLRAEIKNSEEPTHNDGGAIVPIAKLKRSEFDSEITNLQALARLANKQSSFSAWARLWSRLQGLLSEAKDFELSLQDKEKIESSFRLFKVTTLQAQKAIATRFKNYLCPLVKNNKNLITSFEMQIAGVVSQTNPSLGEFEAAEAALLRLARACMAAPTPVSNGHPLNIRNRVLRAVPIDLGDSGSGGGDPGTSNDGEAGHWSDRPDTNDESPESGDTSSNEGPYEVKVWEPGPLGEGDGHFAKVIYNGAEKVDSREINLPESLGPKNSSITNKASHGDSSNNAVSGDLVENAFTIRGADRASIAREARAFSAATAEDNSEISRLSGQLAERMLQGEERLSKSLESLKLATGTQSLFPESPRISTAELSPNTSRIDKGSGIHEQIRQTRALSQGLRKYLDKNPLTGAEQIKASLSLQTADVLLNGAEMLAQMNMPSAAQSLANKAEKLLVTIGPTVLRVGVGFIPLVGDLADITEAITGKDVVTGEELSSGQRLLAAVSVVIGSRATYEAGAKYLGASLKEASEVVAKKLSYSETKELIKFFKRNEVAVKEYGKGVIEGILAGTSKIRKSVEFSEKILYRYHATGGKSGFWYTTELIESVTERVERFAAPAENTMEKMTKYRMKSGYEIIDSIAAPLNGHIGGGRQIYIPSLEAVEEIL